MKATAMKPNTDVPHTMLNASYMLLPANGISAFRRERKTVDAAETEAAWMV
jgi:hypothetical protein